MLATAPGQKGREADPRVHAAGGYDDPGASIAEEQRRIEAVLAEIGAQARRAVDANGRFELETGIA
ncbi:hypothetical protein ASG72_12330 [Bosea sp. Leaf344]|nr:hypothetical protein ASG72_12330 [Bosea sp. Leaf344]